MKTTAGLAAALVMIAAPALAAPGLPAPKPAEAFASPNAPRPVVIGYLPTFKDYNTALEATDLSKLTHINVAFINPDKDGRFVAGDRLACSDNFQTGNTPIADLRTIVDRAHAAKVQVLPSLGGGQIPACSGDWVTLLAPANRQTTVANLLQLVDDFGLDGLDIDLEWDVLTAIDGAGAYVPFVAELSAGLKARGKLLTCATASNEGGMVPLGSLPYFDYINIMSYDGVGMNPDGTTYGDAGGEHASMAMARRDIAVWQARGARKEQIVLGLPFYGHAFGSYVGGYHDYKDLLAAYGPETAEKDLIGTACVGCDYITYNGQTTIRAKAALAAELGTGIMIWELYADAKGADSLLSVAVQSLDESSAASATTAQNAAP